MANSILMVEGTDDEHVIKHICGGYNLPHIDDIKTHEGVDNLLDSIPSSLADNRGEDVVIGIVIDADADFDARWRSLRDIFARAGYPNVPDRPDPNGTILDAPDETLLPKTGVWLMPDNKTPGILEDFLRFLVPDRQSALFAHAERSVESIPAPDKRFSDIDAPKALMHTWLAWQAEPGRPYGTAITARFMDSGLPQAQRLADWLRRLFDAAAES